MSSIVIQGDTSGSITVEAPSVAGTHTLTLPKATGNIATDATVGLGTKNRIINGDMRIDQRNAGASVTNISGGVFSSDRFNCYGTQATKYTVQQNAGAVTPPEGFTNYLGATSSSAYSVLVGDWFAIRQICEGYNVADLGWGTADAKTVTLSFWVRSSLTGTFGASIYNGIGNRSYPFTYTISVANTWEKKTVTIAGDTTGTWATTNSGSLTVNFSLGSGTTVSGTAGAWAGAFYTSATGATSVVGTSGATFYITGVQLEVGENATPFEYRMYSQELAMCQRYFEKSYNYANVPSSVSSADREEHYGSSDSSNNSVVGTSFKVTKRLVPTMKYYRDDTGALGVWLYARSGVGYTNTTITNYTTTESSWRAYMGVGASYAVVISKGHWTADAEL